MDTGPALAGPPALHVVSPHPRILQGGWTAARPGCLRLLGTPVGEGVTGGPRWQLRSGPPGAGGGARVIRAGLGLRAAGARDLWAGRWAGAQQLGWQQLEAGWGHPGGQIRPPARVCLSVCVWGWVQGVWRRTGDNAGISGPLAQGGNVL